MTTEWEAMVKERSERLQAAHVRRSVRRGMWSELGLSWADCGPLGDICLGMAYQPGIRHSVCRAHVANAVSAVVFRRSIVRCPAGGA